MTARHQLLFTVLQYDGDQLRRRRRLSVRHKGTWNYSLCQQGHLLGEMTHQYWVHLYLLGFIKVLGCAEDSQNANWPTGRQIHYTLIPAGNYRRARSQWRDANAFNLGSHQDRRDRQTSDILTPMDSNYREAQSVFRFSKKTPVQQTSSLWP